MNRQVGGDGLADRMRQAMEAAGLKQIEVAHRMGKNPGQIADWLAGRKSPRAINLRAYAEAVGTSVDFLVRMPPADGQPPMPIRKPAPEAPSGCTKEEILLYIYRSATPERQKEIFAFAMEGIE